jgi:phenylacetate-CoA ligase
MGDSFALIRAKDKKKIRKFLRNETIIIPLNISEEKLEEILQLLKKKNITVLMGYPTVMFELALCMEKKNIKLPIKSLISTSEMLDDEKRIYVKKVFNCDFVDRYSNEEVGLIAQQEIFGEDYYVNKFGVLVEILDLSNNTVDSGEIGRVVVSDLNNDLIPLLRYDTGDLAIAGEYKNNQLITIKKVLGRTADVIFNVKNKPVSSLALGPAIYKPLSNASLNIQFQLLQLSKKGYSLKLRSTEKEISNNVRALIISELKEILGHDSSINFEYLSDIPPLESGKRPVYVNLFKRNVIQD